jgi:hypothetical protein
MPSETDVAPQLAGMMEICKQVADEASVYADERRRIHAVLVYLSDDESARAVAATVVRESGQQAILPSLSPSSERAAIALLCRHDGVVHALRGAGYEISDAEDPGGGRISTVFVVGRRCVRGVVVVDAALAAQHETLKADLDAAPASVLNACHEGVKEAQALREGERREGAIVVCECNDPAACAVIDAIARERGVQVVPEPDKAAAILHPHADIARIARAHGYAFTDMPEPRVGWMRVFLFFGGRVTASVLEIESEAEVARAEQEDNAIGEAHARRIFEAKEHQISRAVGMLVASGLLLQQIVVVFGSRSATALGVYGELAALPGMKGFPRELPQGVPIASVPYDSFMQILRRHGGDVRGIDAAVLGVNQVRIATFTPDWS